MVSHSLAPRLGVVSRPAGWVPSAVHCRQPGEAGLEGDDVGQDRDQERVVGDGLGAGDPREELPGPGQLLELAVLVAEADDRGVLVVVLRHGYLLLTR
jgi:hypothetical protein